MLSLERVWLDETFDKVRIPDVKYHEDGREFRGLSLNQLCISIDYDKSHAIYFMIKKELTFSLLTNLI